MHTHTNSICVKHKHYCIDAVRSNSAKTAAYLHVATAANKKCCHNKTADDGGGVISKKRTLASRVPVLAAASTAKDRAGHFEHRVHVYRSRRRAEDNTEKTTTTTLLRAASEVYEVYPRVRRVCVGKQAHSKARCSRHESQSSASKS